ncbi:MAG TPA: DUF1772 domain-containing protein [Pseudolabrys sp.]|nr:DUF1772 domain-containing protein [Pseudolabrys sp.]
MLALQFIALFLTAFALVPGGSHAASLLTKLAMTQDAYFTAQAVYNGWSLFGIASLGALAANAALAFAVRKQIMPFRLMLLAVTCLAGGLAIFFAFTYPANVATANWTAVPADWQALRWQWEMSHVANAALTLAAFCALCLATLLTERA